jgi:hypothetical protein
VAGWACVRAPRRPPSAAAAGCGESGG